MFKKRTELLILSAAGIIIFLFVSLHGKNMEPDILGIKDKNMNIENGAGKLYIRIFKAEKELEVWKEKENSTYELYKVYNICAYSGGLGPKKKEGDKKSPEGFYFTKKEFLNPDSQYYLSFNIGYPNEYDKAHGYTGSYIMIHGKCVSIGCYAMTDEYIEEIYGLVEKALKEGQNDIPIHIFPFKMTKNNLKKYKNTEFYSFWIELKPAYDYFEKNKIPPLIGVEGMKYIIKN